jgi:phosphoenolpyruvate carboxykinase (GTP)
MPKDGDLDLSGLTIAPDNIKEMMSVKVEEWRAEIPDIEAHYALFGKRLPQKLKDQLAGLSGRLK